MADIPVIVSFTASPLASPADAPGFSTSINATGNPQPTITYQWEYRSLGGGTFNPVVGQTSSTLSGLSPNNYLDGVFRCVAIATNGSVPASTTTNYVLADRPQSNMAPGPPSSVTADYSGDTINFSWTAPESGGPTGIHNYAYRIISTTRDTGWQNTLDAVYLYGSMSGFSAGTYTVYVAAIGNTYYSQSPTAYAQVTIPGDAGGGTGTEGTDEGLTGGDTFVLNGSKTMVYSSTERDLGYQTYSTKFNIDSCTDTIATGLFFNQDPALSSANGTYFVEFVSYQVKNAVATANNWTYDQKQRYGIIAYYKSAAGETSISNILGYSDVTNIVKYVLSKMPKVIKYAYGEYWQLTDNIFNLKVLHYPEKTKYGSTSSDSQHVLRVFLNGLEIRNWLRPNATFTGFEKTVRKAVEVGTGNYLGPQKLTLPNAVAQGTVFGVYSSRWSKYCLTRYLPKDGTYNFTFATSTTQTPKFLEIYATSTPLVDPDTNYYHTTTRFLTDAALGKVSTEKTFMSQMTPEIAGLNYYDVQYTTPAATNVDVLPVEYLMRYYPSSEAAYQKDMQVHIVHQGDLAYSSPINTGFRSKMLIANNSNSLVFVKKEPDDLITVDVNLNLWTHNVITHSDQQILEKYIDQANQTEVVQIDSEWIQSERAAHQIATIIGGAVDNFSKDIKIDIFGNPLIQIGDYVDLSYSLTGIQNQRYFVKQVSHSFDGGLKTSLVLNKVL